jgi:translation initiation factor 2B subunit (eIF-2B alpha/beta/delta family)
LEGGEDALARAQTEIEEEVGLTREQIKLVRAGQLLRVYDEQKGTVWLVHPFLFDITEREVRIDWEHSYYKWGSPDELTTYDTVPRLKQAFDRVRWDLQIISSTMSKVNETIENIARDRTNGASLLGRKAIAAFEEAIHLSPAISIDDLFRDLLLISLKLRAAQPSMATITNLTGSLLYKLDSRRETTKSIAEFKTYAEDLVTETISNCKVAAEQMSRNLSNNIRENLRILTHSYSGTVKRALQLCYNEGKNLLIYATESEPGSEGRKLARDLTQLGLHVTLLSDKTIGYGHFPFEIDAVVIGADSILVDGSIVNKIGTKNIALIANKERVPLYVASEISKLHMMHFLGEPLEIGDLFEVTPSNLITAIVTERGNMKPRNIEAQMKDQIRELYT